MPYQPRAIKEYRQWQSLPGTLGEGSEQEPGITQLPGRPALRQHRPLRRQGHVPWRPVRARRVGYGRVTLR